MTRRLLNINVDGGFEIFLNDTVTRARLLTVSPEGQIHMRITSTESRIYRAWQQEVSLNASPIKGRTLSLTVGIDLWSFEDCLLTDISVSGTDIILSFDTPKKNGRTIYAPID